MTPSSGRIGLAAALGLLGLAVLGLSSGRLAPPDPARDFFRGETFDHGVVSPRGRIVSEGVVAGPDGFLLPAGSRGWIEYTTAWETSATPWVRLEVSAFLGDGPLDGRLEIATDAGRGFRTLAENRPLLLGRFEVGQILQGARGATLRVSGENPGPAPRILLRKIGLTGFAAPPHPAIPLLPAAVAVGLLASAACLGSTRWRRRLPLAGLMTVAFVLRYAAFLRVLHARLDPDAVSYRALADRLHLFSPTGFYSGAFDLREPLFPLIVKAGFSVLGEGDASLRLVSLAASLLAVGLSWRLGRGLLGDRWGWLPAAGMAVSLPLAVEGARGLRLEVETVLLLLFADLAFRERRWPPPARALAVGAAAGLVLLTRSSHLPGLGLLIPLAVRGWGAGRRGFGQAAAALLVMGLLYVPHAAALARLHGHPLHDQRMHVRWFANQEFSGQPGFPSRDAIARDAYAGGPLDLGTYLVGMHSVGEVVVGILRGTGKILSRLDLIGRPDAVREVTGLELAWVDWVVRLLGWAGLVAAVARGKAWLLVAILALSAPVAFQYDRGLTETHRLILHVLPFYWCGIGLLLAHLTDAAARLRRGHAGEETHA
ncbi:MAG: glycosyltransferase family 39 protein [Candidatus Methylomirabilota bacterium]